MIKEITIHYQKGCKPKVEDKKATQDFIKFILAENKK